jgi:hypothetical protein
MKKNYKTLPWKGWAKIEPKGKQRTIMYKKCGKKCFLGTISRNNKQHPDFPICAKGTCKVNSKGLWAAYIRAKQWGKPYSSYNSNGKIVKFKTKKRTKRVYYKGSKPTRKRYVYSNVAKKAKKMLKIMN